VWVTKYVTLTKNKGTFTELIRIQDKYLYTFSSFVCYMCIKDDRNILSVGGSDLKRSFFVVEWENINLYYAVFFSRNSRLRKGGIDGTDPHTQCT